MKRFWLLFLFLAVAGPSLLACSNCGKVKVDFYGNFCADSNYTITLNGATATGMGEGHGCGYVESSKANTKLKPYQSYTLTTDAGKASSAHINLTVAPCYKLFIDGAEKSSVDAYNTPDGNGNSCRALHRTWTVMVKPVVEDDDSGTGGNGGGELNSVHWWFSMGGLPNGGSAESILIEQSTLDADSYAPATLLYAAPTTDVTVIRDGTSALRQVKAPEVLADIITINANKFEIRFYTSSGALSGGLYQPPGSPFVIWTVESPPGFTPGERLRITESRGGTNTVNEFGYNATTMSWSYIQGGLREELHDVVTLGNGDKQTTITVRNPTTGVLASKRREIRHTFPWGDEIIQSVADPDGAALTTTYEFYVNAAELGNYSHLKWAIHPDGSWEKYDYNNSPYNAGTVRFIYRPWKDAPTAPSQATFQSCRVTEYGYSGSSGSYLFSTELSSEYEYVLGIQTVDRDYSTWVGTLNGKPTKTKTTHFDVGTEEVVAYKAESAPPYSGRLASTTHPDGRVENYTYEFGGYNAANGTFTPGTGTFVRQILTRGTTASPAGVANKTTRTVTIRDAGGNTLVEEELVYSGGGYSSLTKTVHSYNAEGQLYQSVRDGRIVYDAVWTNGAKTSETDEAGIITTFIYDALDRVFTETRAGITTTYTYDADGRTLLTSRAAGGLALSTGAGFDLAGRQTSDIGEDGLATSTAYTAGGRIETRTLPSGATEITERYLDTQTKSVTGTAVVARYYDYGADATGAWSKNLMASAASPRWKQSWRDSFGNTTRIDQPGYFSTVQTIYTHDALGRVTKQTIPGEASEVAEYSPINGTLLRAGRDWNDNGALEPAGSDRIEQREVSYLLQSGNWFRVSTQSRYETMGNGTPTVLSTVKGQLSGLAANVVSKSLLTDGLGNTTTTTVTVNRATQTATETVDTPDSDLDAVRVTVAGLVTSSSTSTVAQPTSFLYDTLGRRTHATDPRGVETITAYEPGTNRIQSSTVAGKTTNYDYYPAGQVGAGLLKYTLNPDSTHVYQGYNLRGQQTRTWGNGTYPVETIYDAYGQYAELRTFRGGSGWDAATWPSSPGTADTTIWTYQESTGLLTAKTDAQSHPVSYTYTASGKPETRSWARGLTTNYYYNYLGALSFTDYSDTTPDVSFTQDRAGRFITITDASGSRVLAYSNTQNTESITDGILGGLTLTTAFDGFGRKSGFTSATGSWSESTGYAYDTKPRLMTVTAGNNTATYGYLPNSDLLSTTTAKNSGSTRLTATRTWDTSNRLKTMTNASTGGTRSFDVTTFDSMHRRQQVAWEDGSKWDYGYDNRGEVTSGNRKWGDNAAVLGQQYGYQFDNIGNRTTATTNGRTSTYTPNNLNQYAQRTVPGAVDVLGNAGSNATVTVNGSATQRQGGYFNKELTADNSAAPALSTATISATATSGTTTRTSTKLLAKTPEVFTHDFDGNLTNDGLWTYLWDAENRLVGMETVAAVPDAAKRKLAFAYDAQGRRIRKQVWQWQQGGWLLHHTFRFVHDGWNLVAELADTGRRIRTYAWGLDLSGTMDGTGGVGGLLFETDHFGGKSFTAAYDLNGNITSLVDLSNGAPSVAYEYTPFGELIRASGEYALLNPFRFATKYSDDESGLSFYDHRYYTPATGRWLTRDPIGEDGGENLYNFVGNNPINEIDVLGLAWHRKKSINDKRRMLWIRDDPQTDSFATLATKVKLDPNESGKWAKQEGSDCRYSVPNVYINAKLLSYDKADDFFITTGGEGIGSAFTFTGQMKYVKAGTADEMYSKLSEFSKDIWGFKIFAHGNQEGGIFATRRGDAVTDSATLRGALKAQGFKYSKLSMMYCFSALDGRDAWWRALSFQEPTMYYGVNVCGLDTGPKPPKPEPPKPPKPPKPPAPPK